MCFNLKKKCDININNHTHIHIHPWLYIPIANAFIHIFNPFIYSFIHPYICYMWCCLTHVVGKPFESEWMAKIKTNLGKPNHKHTYSQTMLYKWKNKKQNCHQMWQTVTNSSKTHLLYNFCCLFVIFDFYFFFIILLFFYSLYCIFLLKKCKNFICINKEQEVEVV